MRGLRRGGAVLSAFAVAAAVALPEAGRAQIRQEEALALAVPPPAVWVRATAYLNEEELARARELAGPAVAVDRSVVTYYVAAIDDEPVGAAYFDAHRVRTKREVLMVVVTPEDVIERVEVLAFMEPAEYMASEAWIGQLVGRRLDLGLSLKGDVINMTGATLTATAMTDAVRRVLALHEVIRPFERAVR